MWVPATILFYLWCFTQGQDVPTSAEADPKIAEGEQKLSDNIVLVLEHFKQADPIGIPGASIPDPYPVPPTTKGLGIGTTVYMKNTFVYGMSKFRIKYVNAEIGTMEAQAVLTIDKLQARGNYTLTSWLNKAQGPFTVNITGLLVKANANLGVGRDGKLRTEHVNIDLAFSTISVNFQDLGLIAAMFQGIVNSLGPVIFDTIKPQLLTKAYDAVQKEIDTKLDEIAGDMRFPNSISPLDMVIADARKMVRANNFDPYKVKDTNMTNGDVFGINLSGTWLYGISSFHRVGNITLKIENNVLIADFEIGTQRIEGQTQWEIVALNLMSQVGTASFSVEYISGRFIVAQPLDTRKTPEIKGLDLEIGNIQVRSDGAGTLDYVIEFVVNILPNLLRYQIMDAVEGPLKDKLQEELDKLNVEEMIKENLPMIDEFSEEGLKQALKAPESEVPYNDDEFFNF